ncbi:MAG: hypothetical protein JW986_07785 [Methanotrichaceae archaeon]|nr:hypothetical protein [Methanotrichaceae archaeon]
MRTNADGSSSSRYASARAAAAATRVPRPPPASRTRAFQQLRLDRHLGDGGPLTAAISWKAGRHPSAPETTVV